MKVSKFGGSSLANASQIKKVIAIVHSDSKRQYIVVSAPGERYPKDKKVTDLLKKWHSDNELHLPTNDIQRIIKERYSEIILGLGIKFDLESEFDEINQNINKGLPLDYVASRGEYLIGKIISLALGYKFVDPATFIHIDENGQYIQEDNQHQLELLGRNIVIPGYYGSLPDGSIKTFTRGGSDITGAIVARLVFADIYENWTDVSGLLMADPRIVDDPKKIETVTYRELRELAYMGASVFHEEAMFPIQGTGITTNIRNTNDPYDTGTYIKDENERRNPNIITGIAGRKNFTVITIEKKMMNRQIGFVRKILAILEKNKISYEHMPSGIDTVSIIIDDEFIKGKLEKVRSEIEKVCSPDEIKVQPDMAMIAIVGQGMVRTHGVSARILDSVAKKEINIRMINQGSSEINIIIGVKNRNYKEAIRAIYASFVA